MEQREHPRNLKTTLKPVEQMSRNELIAEARSIYIRNNKAIGEQEAIHRFNALVDGNTTAQLRKYVKKRRGK